MTELNSNDGFTKSSSGTLEERWDSVRVCMCVFKQFTVILNRASKTYYVITQVWSEPN